MPVGTAVETAQSLDYRAFATNLGIFVGFIVAAILGIKNGFGLFDKQDKKLPEGKQHVIAASLIETVTLTHWSETNRSIIESNKEVVDALVDLKAVLEKNMEATYSARNQLSSDSKELCHKIELAVMRLTK